MSLETEVKKLALNVEALTKAVGALSPSRAETLPGPFILEPVDESDESPPAELPPGDERLAKRAEAALKATPKTKTKKEEGSPLFNEVKGLIRERLVGGLDRAKVKAAIVKLGGQTLADLEDNEEALTKLRKALTKKA